MVDDESRILGFSIHTDGMSLRDYFAAKAMQALIANEVIHSVTMKEANKAGIPEEFAVAQMSFMVADAMLKAREE
jgi:hypothetical protein